MTTAKKFSILIDGENKSPDVMADIFIEEMALETGCSREFLDRARDSVYKLFRDVEGETLETCLDDIKGVITQQAETEGYCQRAIVAANKLSESQKKIGSEFAKAGKQIAQAKNDLNIAMYTLYGLSGNSVHSA
jgi:hypothetical protein